MPSPHGEVIASPLYEHASSSMRGGRIRTSQLLQTLSEGRRRRQTVWFKMRRPCAVENPNPFRSMRA